MLRFLTWVAGWFTEHRKSWRSKWQQWRGGGDGRDKKVHVTILVDLPLVSLGSLMSAHGICMIAGPGRTEPVPWADPWSPRSELQLFHYLQLQVAAQRKPIGAAGRRRCGAWGASLKARKGASREQEGGLQCLGAKFSSALFWVTTFTMFLHPESFRPPARLRCFQLMGSHASLTTGLVQGLPSSLTAALRSSPCSAGCTSPWGGQMAKLGSPMAYRQGKLKEWHRSWKQSGVVTVTVRIQAQRGVWAIDLYFCASLTLKDKVTEGENA